MNPVLHPPESVTVEGDLAVDARRELERVLLAAIERSLAAAGAGASGGAAAAGESGAAFVPVARGEVSEPADPGRLDDVAGSYQVPSYRDEGRLSGVQLLAGLPKAWPGFIVLGGASPLEGRLLITFPGNRYVLLSSPRYASAGTLLQALALGEAIFGTTSFGIAVGPVGSPALRYLAVGTREPVSNADLGEQAAAELSEELAGRGVEAFVGKLMEGVLEGTDGTYLVRGFMTSDRGVYWPSAEQAALWFAQLDAERAVSLGGERETYRVQVFDDIDALIEMFDAGDDSVLQDAAGMLSRLDEVAFSLVGWQAKARYLEILLEAWTHEEEEKAVVAIFKSLENDSQVDAVVARLRRARRYDQLVDDLNSQLYELLTVIGRKFPRDHGPLTFGGLVALLQSFGLLPRTPLQVITGLVAGAPGIVTGPPDLIDNARQAALGVANMATDLGESLVTIFTEPGKVLQGIEGLAQLAVKLQLAQLGDLQAMSEIAALLSRLGEQVLAGMRGADRLGAGEKVVRRLRWRLIWEIASLFIGVGEIKAMIKAVGIGEKLAGVLRFLGILTRLGEAAEEGVEGARLARLAALLKAERGAFASADEVARLLAKLPEADVRSLGKLLSRFDVLEGETLAGLAARSTELRAAVGDAAAKAEILKTLAGKAGGLSDEIAEAFRSLAGGGGMSLAEVRRVVEAIPEAEGARFAATLKRIPLGRLAPASRAALLELLAASPARMDAVARLGLETFAAVWRRAAGEGAAINHYVGVLDRLEARFAQEGGQAEYRMLLDRLERDEPAAWLQAEAERRAQAGAEPIAEWLRLAEGSPRAQAGLDLLLRRGHDDVVENMLARQYEYVVRGQLEQIAELSEHQADGLAAIKRIEADLSGDIGGHWDEVLDLPAQFRDPLLDLVADLEPSVDSGFDLAIKRGLTGGHYDIQGALGHLFAARTLRDRFPGARFRFELPAARREIDIQLSIGGRQIDVEVKTNLALEPTVNNAQIYKDLERHIGDRWENLLYLYAPQQAGNTAAVERAMLRNLARLHSEGKLPAGMTLADGTNLLQARIGASRPWRLVDVFAY